MLLHTAVYAGVPAANAAFAIAQRVLDDRTVRTAMSPPERRPHFVQSLERGLAVIRAFDAAAPGADAQRGRPRTAT